MQIGFIGLGIMGAHIARNLQRGGHALTVHDIRRESAASHLAAGAVWAATPREAAAGAELVFTSLPGPPEVEAVCRGPDGILAGLPKCSAYFDLTTNAPSTVRRLSTRMPPLSVTSRGTRWARAWAAFR